MADTTTRYGFPYQEAGDPPDGADLGQALAEAVEDALGDLADSVLWARGTAEPIIHNTTLTDDLSIVTPGPGRWTITGCYFFRSPAAAGFKIAILGDASGIPHGNIRFGIDGNTAMAFGNQSISIPVSGSASFYHAKITGVLENTSGGAGTLKLQYGQQTTNAGDTGPIAGRWLRLEPID